jgi:tol-pal system-associated acyl-CoA thioesterase
MNLPAEFQHRVRVYYEDTDCMGVVYHANYLRFFERARSEAMAETGTSITAWADRGLMFPVYSVNVTFKNAARLGDALRVVSKARQLSQYRLAFDQRIESEKDGRVLVEAKVELVCTDLKGNLQTMPQTAFS